MPQTDVFQQIRTHLERTSPRPLVLVGRRAKVLARSSAEFVTDLPEKWQLNYERRNRHRHTGFFAPNHIPFRTFGNLKYTDAYDLVGDSLGVPVAKFPGKVYHLSHRIQDHSIEHNDLHDHQHQIIRVVRDASQRKPLPHSRSVGLSAIRLVLGAQERSMRDVEMGSSFRHSLAREDERMNFLQEIRSRAKKTVHCSRNTPTSAHLHPTLHTASSKACLTLSDLFHHKPPPRKRLPKITGEAGEDGCDSKRETAKQLQLSTSPTVGPYLYVALAAAQFKLHHGHGRGEDAPQEQQDNSQQQRRNCTAKLKMVHGILCCLYNMRNRDLRSRDPLPRETINSNAKIPLQPLKDHHEPHHHIHHHHLRLGAHTPTVGHSLHHRHSILPHEFSGHMTSLHHHHHHYGKLHHKHTHSPAKSVKAPETWEELVALEQQLEKEGDGGGPATGSHERLHHRPLRILPPWQRQVIYVDEECDTQDPVKQLQDCIESFQYSKNELAQRLRDSLNERKINLQRHLVSKLQELTISANVEESLEVMRERAYQLKREERAEEDNKPAWFNRLEKEANSLPHNEEGRALLEKLKPFLCVDIDAIPHVTEKLCMLIISMPATHLCLHPVVSAVKFVLEYTLKTPSRLYDQWLEIRKLPLVTTEISLNSPPVYVLGMSL